MKLPITLSVYMIRQYLLAFVTILAGLLSVVFLGEALELLRRSSARTGIDLTTLMSMAGLKLPGTAQILMPSVVLFSSLYFFWRFSRTRELEVTRAAGISVWNFLLPVALAALVVGAIEITIVNPLSAAMTSRFERMEDRYFRGRATTLEISSSGVWISQADSAGQAFIHAQNLKPGSFELQQVIVFENPQDIRNSKRIDADSALLIKGAWLLRNARVHHPGQLPEVIPQMEFKTDLTQERIEESFASPRSLSFWQLGSFIKTLEAAGLSSVRHQLYFQSLVAKPFLLMAMVILASVFGLRSTRQGGVLFMIVVGLILGLLLYVINHVVQTLAESGGIPVILAAWGPPIVGLFAGAAALFHFEDG